MSERSSPWQLQTIVSQLRGARDQWRTRNGRLSGEHGGRELPSREAVAQILESLCGALFPMRLGPVDLREESEDFYVGHTLDVAHILQPDSHAPAAAGVGPGGQCRDAGGLCWRSGEAGCATGG